MFNRKYAARDRRKPRLFICKLAMADRARFKLERALPLPDVGYDAVDLGLIDDLMDEYLRTQIDIETWRRYTTPQPFVTVPSGGRNPRRNGGRMPKNVFRKPTERAAEKALVAAFSKEAREKLSDELPPLPTQAELIAKAGGRAVDMAAVTDKGDVAAWHEQDPTL